MGELVGVGVVVGVGDDVGTVEVVGVWVGCDTELTILVLVGVGSGMRWTMVSGVGVWVIVGVGVGAGCEVGEGCGWSVQADSVAAIVVSATAIDAIRTRVFRVWGDGTKVVLIRVVFGGSCANGRGGQWGWVPVRRGSDDGGGSARVGQWLVEGVCGTLRTVFWYGCIRGF